MRSLRSVYERHGLRGSFNVEVMQQLAYIRLGDEHPELKQIASEWEDVVRETYSRGHDVQLHVHPQWSDAVYDGRGWDLRGAWSLFDYSATDAAAMLAAGKEYLERLLAPLAADYRCVSFRSGSWCIAPSDHLLDTLVQMGIVLDMSIAEGLVYDTPHIKLDYRAIDEPFRPYYPVMQDARRVASEPQAIVCVPTHTFQAHLGGFGLRAVARTVQRRTAHGRAVLRYFVAPRDTAIPDGGYEGAEYYRREWGDARMDSAATKSKHKVSDLCGLSYVQMLEMLRDIRTRAREAGAGAIPVILENHSKDVGDYAPLELFARAVAAAPDLKVITLTDLARNLQAGEYSIRHARSTA
jgi:hypothetical protein